MRLCVCVCVCVSIGFRSCIAHLLIRLAALSHYLYVVFLYIAVLDTFAVHVVVCDALTQNQHVMSLFSHSLYQFTEKTCLVKFHLTVVWRVSSLLCNIARWLCSEDPCMSLCVCVCVCGFLLLELLFSSLECC